MANKYRYLSTEIVLSGNNIIIKARYYWSALRDREAKIPGIVKALEAIFSY